MTCGIYMIKNKIDGKMYVGQAVNIEKRWTKHCGGYYDTYIDRAIKKYGKDNFELIVLRECEKDSDLLNKLEKHYIKKYNTFEDKNHYNLTPGGDFNPSKLPEVRKKMSEARKGTHHSQETRKKMSETHKGKIFTQEHRKNLSEANKGRVVSQETRKKISEALKGKPHTQETREKISRALNTTGYYRVSKVKDKRKKQGFYYAYFYYDGKQKYISSVNINKLEKKVKDRGLPWKKL